jgi:hypothetical protein
MWPPNREVAGNMVAVDFAEQVDRETQKVERERASSPW